MFERRIVLKYGLAGLTSLLADGLSAQLAAVAPPVDSPTPAFDPASVNEAARALSKKPYKAPAADLPDAFASLSHEQYASIRNLPGSALWASESAGYAIEPLHRGFVFTTPIAINVIENGVPRRLAYNPADFAFGQVKAPTEVKDLGFSGFRVLRLRAGQAPLEVAIFQGASFFRSLANGQGYGVTARGLSIRTADPKGEEFPLFRNVWIEKPTLPSDALVIHAVLDSESVSGAYRFTLRAGEATIIDTECTLFPRVNLDHVGIAAMAATHVSGTLDRRRSDDVRPGIYDVAGLAMLNGKDEWLWRPVSNRETLQLSAFVDDNPRGFGFLQRDREFGRFLDDDNRWERRPSLWIEPIGDWGQGNVTLVEIPSESEVNQNIIAYWRPRAVLTAGAEVMFAYRQLWCWTPPERPSGATVTLSRGGRPPGAPANTRRRRFMVDFNGDIIGDQQRSAEITPQIVASPGTVSSVRTFVNRDRKTWRVTFDVDPGNEALSELRLQLEVQGKPVSESWMYRWTP
jgi:glucans biosynthesis protein